MSKSKLYTYFNSWLGTGLLTSTGKRKCSLRDIFMMQNVLGDKWHHRRKLLTPAFHFTILQEFFAVFKAETQKVIQKIEVGSQVNDDIDIMPIVTQFTLETIGGNLDFIL